MPMYLKNTKCHSDILEIKTLKKIARITKLS